MNTVKSVGYGWLTLIFAGGGAYYFAKKSINQDRAERALAERQKREMQAQLEVQYSGLSNGVSSNGNWQNSADTSNPSQEASQDPAPTRHAPETEGQKVREKSKYEASEPFRSRKGDRFS